MNFEKPIDPNLEGRLSEEEAHDEANELRVRADISPKTGKVISLEQGTRIEREATPEDYDAALKAVEDLKDLAQKDPTAFERLMKYGTRSSAAIMLPFGVLFSIYAEAISQDKGMRQAVKEDISSAKDVFSSDYPFTEAQRRLKALKDEAERFAEDEQKAG